MLRLLIDDHLHVTGVAHGIFQQVLHTPLEAAGVTRHRVSGAACQGDVLANVLQVSLQALQQGVDVDVLPGFVDLTTADKLQRGRHQPLHVGQVFAKALLLLLVIKHFGAQAQAGDWRAQVVGHRRQKACALGQAVQQTLLHQVEGLGGAADFHRPFDFQWFAADIVAQRLGGLSQLV